MMRRSRRNVLRGAGVCLALPWLESLAPRGAAAQDAAMPRRYLPITFPCGAAGQWWEHAPAFGSTAAGASFVLSRVHEPLAALKDKLLVLSRVANYSWNEGNTSGTSILPADSRLAAALGTCVDADQRAVAAGEAVSSATLNGVSADQVIAQGLAGVTPIPSLQLGLGTYPGSFDGRSWAYSQAYSWAAPSSPLKRVVNPKAVFDAMAGLGISEEGRRKLAENRSVIDAVVADAASLKSRVGVADRLAIDEFMQSFRDIERRVVAIAGCPQAQEPTPIADGTGPLQGLNQGDGGYDRAEHAAVMSELIAMAFRCDATRVISYMLDDARSNFDYSFIPEADRVFGAADGLSDYHGSCANGSGSVEEAAVNGVYSIDSNASYATVQRWWVRQVAELAGKLAAMPEGDGTVLDHTLIHLMSEMRTHDERPWDLPMLLLGGTGFIKQGCHIALAANPADRQLRDLYFTIQRQYFGLDVASFGDGPVPNALLEEILA